MARNLVTDIQDLGHAIAEIVIVDAIDPDAQNAKWVAGSSAESSIWNDYMINNRFEEDPHRYMMGITSPNGFKGTSVAFVQLAAKTLLWIADWTVMRTGAKPIIPSKIPSDPEWVFLDAHYEPGMVELMPDGETAKYRLSGIYVFGHKNPSDNILANMYFSRPPWLQDVFDRTVTTSMEEKNVIDTSGSSSSTTNNDTRDFNSSSVPAQ